MGEWRNYKLGNLTLKVGSGATPRGGSNSYKNEGVTLIRSQNVLDFKFSINGLAFIDDEQAGALNNVIVQNNDVLLNITGDSVARCCIVPVSVLPARVNQHVSIIRIDPQKAYYKFIFYSLQYLKEELLLQSEIGGTRKALTKGMIENINLLLPPLPEQKAIASVLSSLDDKIDLLHRQNKTLEAMAETLFRQWFVEEAEEEWEEGCLGDIIELKYGKGLRKDLRTGIGYPVLGSNGIVDYHSDFLVEGPGIVIGRKGTLDKTIYIFENFYPIDTTYYVKSKINSKSLLFEYYLLKTINFEDMNSDSAVPGLNREIALSTQVTIPPLDKINTFNSTILNYSNKKYLNKMQIIKIEKLRDILLPKLMSGEVGINI